MNENMTALLPRLTIDALDGNPHWAIDWLLPDARFTGRMLDDCTVLSDGVALTLEVSFDDVLLPIRIELQRTPDPDTVPRLLEVNAWAYRLYKHPVHACIVYLQENGHDEEPRACTQLGLPNEDEVIRFNLAIYDLWDMSQQELFESGFLELIPLFPRAIDGTYHEAVQHLFHLLTSPPS